MFGLTRDFVEQGGTFMVLDRPGGLKTSHLSQVQLGMIRSSRIPCFLPMHTKELDLCVTLQYNITGKRMLSQALRGEKLTLTEFYGLLLQVVTALNDCSMYMLRPAQYILSEEYMFIEGPLHLGKLYLTYVPLDKLVSEPEPVRHSFKEFLTHLVSSVSELRGSGVQTLMQYCNDESFNLPGLKRMLIELLAGEGNHGEEKREAPIPSRITGSMISKSSELTTSTVKDKVPDARKSKSGAVDEHVERMPRSINRMDDVVASPDYDQSRYGQRTERSAVTVGSSEKDSMRTVFPTRKQPEWDMPLEEESQDKTSKSPARIYWLLAGLLGSATMWRFLYLNNPSQVMLVVSILGTLVLLGVSLMGWKGKIGKSSDGRDDYSDALPMFDSVELEDTGGRKHKSFRFQADKLTGWFGGKSKDSTQDEESSSNEEWRWERKSPSLLRAHQELQPGELSNNLSHDHQHEDREFASSSSGDYYEQLLPKRTETLIPSGDGGTVLLERKAITTKDGERGVASQPNAFLEVVIDDNSVPERVELHQPHFIIGRSAEVSQYVAQIVGTSRAHVEVSRGTSGYMIKDLGSKNGTILKGEPMVPYKEYPLQEGDTFLIAGGKYTFHVA